MKIITLSFTALMTFSAFSVMRSCSGTNMVSHRLTSPDGNITVEFDVSQKGEATYQIACHGKKIIQASRLGLVREDADFSEGLTLDSVSASCSINFDYQMPQGKKSHYAYDGNERRFYLTNRNGRKIDVVFRASNDGVAFRYIFPERIDEVKTITKEISEFNFSPRTKAFIQPLAAAKSGWCQTNPSYEEIYQQNVAIDKLPFNAPGWVFPALFQDGDFWVLISETAPDRNYCGCRLQQDSTSHIFYIDFPPDAETFPGQFVVLARKSGQTWYLAGINGADVARQLKLNCNFLEEDHTGQLITDASDGRSFIMEEIRVSPRSPLSIKLEKHGGFVIKFD